jgi:hypothetical protein
VRRSETDGMTVSIPIWVRVVFFVAGIGFLGLFALDLTTIPTSGRAAWTELLTADLGVLTLAAFTGASSAHDGVRAPAVGVAAAGLAVFAIATFPVGLVLTPLVVAGIIGAARVSPAGSSSRRIAAAAAIAELGLVVVGLALLYQ